MHRLRGMTYRLQLPGISSTTNLLPGVEKPMDWRYSSMADHMPRMSGALCLTPSPLPPSSQGSVSQNICSTEIILIRNSS